MVKIAVFWSVILYNLLNHEKKKLWLTLSSLYFTFF